LLGTVRTYKREYRARIAMHLRDSSGVEDPKMPNAGGKSLFVKLMLRLMDSRLKSLYQGFEKFSPDLYVEDGSSFSEYGFDAKVVHLPGHSRGGIAVLTSKGDLFSGDLIANANGKPKFTAIVDDAKELASSKARLATLKIRTIYPGYGAAFPIERPQSLG
jgi:hydroxyacylglutathione hydrolase